MDFAARVKAARLKLKADANGTLLSSLFEGGSSITRDHGTICKAGTTVHAEEGNALKYAEQLGLPVPKAHSISTDAELVTIRMEYVEGECLEDVWSSMPDNEKRSIARQLRQIISTMRAATPPGPTLIGACDGPARDVRAQEQYTGGPFELESDFNKFILDFGHWTPQIMQRLFTEALVAHGEHRIVFSHADLSPRNIIVKDGRVKALLDWEFAGWYPEYWEYVKFFSRQTSCRGWYDLAPDIFETCYPSQLMTYQALTRWQRP